MKTLTEQLTKYASYHRNPKNIATHFVGIPMIVLAVVFFLARFTFDLLGLPISIATVLVIATSFYYIKLDIKLGYVMAVFLLIALWLGQVIAEESTPIWLSCSLGLFLVGWVIQFIGHYFEGRKPAFVDDIMGLIIGPLFVAAELGFIFGWRLEVRDAIEAKLKHQAKHQ
jgi:uncharacterized membrane protein YGL010W